MNSKLNLVADPYPPYQYIDHGKLLGVDHDMVKKAFQLSGIEVRVTLHAWDDCIKRMEAGQADGLFQIQPTPEREKQFTFSNLLRTAQTVYLGNKAKSIKLDQYKSHAELISRHSLGVVEGYSYHPEIDELDGKLKVLYSSQELLLQALSNNEIDLALMDIGVAKHLSNGLGVDNILVIPGYEIERQLHVAFQKNLAGLADLFNRGLDDLEQKGLRQKIYSRYNLNT
jgi:polar amino acid transport system substrate-binding protein